MEYYVQGIRCPVTLECFECDLSDFICDTSIHGHIRCPLCGKIHSIIGTITRESSGFISDTDLTVF